ncbi:MAG: hypothetical protein Q8P41_13020 [Pseudomonadota bacterium]|nr:hypothetical protein [Pseudomonadota bacterium]
MSESRTRTTTFSVARVRQVMDNVYDDIQALISRKFLSREEGARWYDDLVYLLNAQVLELFEVQLAPPLGLRRALRYQVRDDGRVQGTMPSGGLDLFSLPSGTAANLCVHYRRDAGDLTAVSRELARRGWTTGGSLVSGAAVADRTYGAGGWGLERSRVGNWDV